MEQNDDGIKWKRPRNRVWTGLFLVAAGLLLLASKMGLGVPAWIFTWPVLLMAIGLYIGLQHNFRHFFWLIPFLWGIFGLIDERMPSFHMHNFIMPLILILIGLVFILRRNSYSYRKQWKYKIKKKYDFITTQEDGEFLDSTSVFGGAKKVVVSKNFKGGDITCFMGGAEIDFTQADIKGTVRLDITAVFGGAKIIVPSNWDVKIEITAAFGGVEDKRQMQSVNVDTSKILVLDGTAVFGGIEICNY